jgi:hypothetical protein
MTTPADNADATQLALLENLEGADSTVPEPTSAPTGEKPQTVSPPSGEASPPVTTPTDNADLLRRQLSAQQEELKDLRQREHAQTLEQEVLAYRQQQDSQHGQEAGQLLGDQYKYFREREQAFAQREEQRAIEQEAKVLSAAQMSKNYGVPFDELMDYASPKAMLLAAKQAQQIAHLSSQVSSIKKNEAPEQTFENGNGSATSSDDTFEIAYAEGRSDDHLRMQKILKARK